MRWVTYLVLAFLSVACGKEPVPEQQRIVAFPQPKQIAPFTLTDHNGALFTEQSLRGRWHLLSFGYTQCPDVCPVTLTEMRAVIAALPPALQSRVRQTFISVDPVRDTQGRLADYAGYFDATAATTTDAAQLRNITTTFGVYYEAQAPDADGFYVVDHTTHVIVTDAHGRYVGVISAPFADTVVIADALAALMQKT